MADSTNILRIIYTFFLGLLIALFVGFGINTFYPGPVSPEFPVELNSVSKEPTEAQVAAQNNYDKLMRDYNKLMEPYNRNVSILAMVAAFVLLAISLIFENKIKILADGVLLGGAFVLIYSLGRAFASNNSTYSFITVSIGLIVVVFLGYHRFVRPHVPASNSTNHTA